MKVDRKFSDQELIAAIRTTDTLNEAIVFMYQQYADTIHAFVSNNSGTQQDAEDIFQETVVTFIELVRKNKFRGQSTVKTFLVAIARNTWLNELKKKQRSEKRVQIFESNREEVETDVSEMIHDRELKQQFRELLDKLGDSCKKILEMYYYENRSMKEIVSHLPYENEQVVRNKKYKCLQQLTGILKLNPLINRFIKTRP